MIRPLVTRPGPRTVPLAALVLGLLAGCEDVSVTAVDVAEITLAPSAASMVTGDTLRLSATPTDGQGRTLEGRTVEWWSEDEAVASVSGGLVHARAPGSTLIRAATGGAEAEAAVEVSPAPVIGLSESELRLEAAAGDAATVQGQVRVANEGGGSLSRLSVEIAWVGDGPTGWLSAELDRDEAPATLAVRATARDLGRGTHRAEIRLHSAAAENSPGIVRVILEVTEEPPSIELSTSAVGFSWQAGASAPPARSLHITNGGGGELRGLEASLEFASGQPTGWVSAGLEGRTAPTRLVIGIRPSGLGPGEYEGTVVVRAEGAANSPRSVRVRLTVDERPPDSDPDEDSEPDDPDDSDPDDPDDSDPDDPDDPDSDDPDSDPDPDTGGSLTVAGIEYDTVGGPQGDRHLRVTVRVVDGAGDPAGGASVSLLVRNTESGQEWSRSGTTGGDGLVTVSLNNHPDGCYETSVVGVSEGSRDWDGVTPSNGYCSG
jgi:hypothetical protein